MTLRTLTKILLLASLILSLAACRGGKPGATIDFGDDTDLDGDAETAILDGDAESADGDAVDTESEAESEAPVVTTLVCPHPGALPFTLQGTEFLNEASRTLATNPKAYFMADENLDIMGNPDAEQLVSGRFARGTDGLTSKPFAGEWVSLWSADQTGAWLELGRVQTDDKGYYSYALPEGKRFATGRHQVYAILEGDQSCAVHAVALWPAGTQVIISDIDGTLTLDDSQMMKQIGDQHYDPKLNGGASELVNAWFDKGYMYIYLTARSNAFRAPTRYWLEAHDFPFMPVVTAPQFVYNDSARAYKRELVQKVVNDFKWDLVAAYGNAMSDIDAYADANVPKDVTFIIGEYAGANGTVAIPDNDYTNHTATYVAAQPAADQPF